MVDFERKMEMVVVNTFEEDGGTQGDIKVDEGAHRWNLQVQSENLK